MADSLVGKVAPDFTAKAVMPDGSISEFSLQDVKGRYEYIVLLFYPLDFSPICPKEIIAFNRKIEEFKKRNALLVGISVDSEYTHLAWRRASFEESGVGNIQFPLLSDLTKNISREYGILFNDMIALRALFIIDNEGIVRHCVINDPHIMRSADEAIRTLDALRYYKEKGSACPVD